MNEFFVALDDDYIGCWNCNSDKKTYIIYDYFDDPRGHWCKDCWYSKLTGIQMKFLGYLMKNNNGFFPHKDTKIGNIMQSYDKYTLPPSIDKSGF